MFNCNCFNVMEDGGDGISPQLSHPFTGLFPSSYEVEKSAGNKVDPSPTTLHLGSKKIKNSGLNRVKLIPNAYGN